MLATADIRGTEALVKISFQPFPLVSVPEITGRWSERITIAQRLRILKSPRPCLEKNISSDTTRIREIPIGIGRIPRLPMLNAKTYKQPNLSISPAVLHPVRYCCSEETVDVI